MHPRTGGRFAAFIGAVLIAAAATAQTGDKYTARLSMVPAANAAQQANVVGKGTATAVLAGNKLTVIVPTANPAAITTPADLAKSGVKVIAAGDEVPITTYATQLVDNLAKQGRLEEALELYDSLCARANSLGLLPEEIDPSSGAFLGNYPQAFSHIGVIASGVNLARTLQRSQSVV